MKDETLHEIVLLLKAEKAEKEVQFKHMSRAIKRETERADLNAGLIYEMQRDREDQMASLRAANERLKGQIKALKDENVSLNQLLDKQVMALHQSRAPADVT